MIVDCDKYRISINAVKGMADRMDSAERVKEIGSISIATYVPIVVVGHYMLELYGEDEELSNLIDRLKKFYGITQVINARSYHGSEDNL